MDSRAKRLRRLLTAAITWYVGGDPMLPPPMRLFHLVRHRDVSGVSGTGVVAEGVRFSDGRVALRWLGDHPSTVAWDSAEDAEATHGHGGATEVLWLDTPPPARPHLTDREVPPCPEPGR